MKTFVLTAIAASLASAVAVAPAQAKDLQVQVNYADLNIASASGAATLADRIETSVNRACARSSDIRDMQAVVLCKDALISNAVSQLDSKGATQAAQALAAKG
jgi:UrcA family protein